MKQIILTLIFSVATAINTFAIDWGKADIGAFEDYSYISDDKPSIWMWILAGIFVVLLTISKIAEYIDKNKK